MFAGARAILQESKNPLFMRVAGGFRQNADLPNVKCSPGFPQLRGALLKKGMIYSPSHGVVDFTVPLFDEFMRRMMPSLAERERFIANYSAYFDVFAKIRYTWL